jgi:hypothetical protein
MSAIEEIELDIQEIKELNKDWKTNPVVQALITSFYNKKTSLRNQIGKLRPTF